LKSCPVPPPLRLLVFPHARHAPKQLSVLSPFSTPTLFFLPLPFLFLCLFCCRALELSTIFAPAPPPLVLANAAATAVFASAPLPLVLAETAATAVFALALPLVLAKAAATAVFARTPLPLVLADTAAATIFASTPPMLVLA